MPNTTPCAWKLSTSRMRSIGRGGQIRCWWSLVARTWSERDTFFRQTTEKQFHAFRHDLSPQPTKCWVDISSFALSKGRLCAFLEPSTRALRRFGLFGASWLSALESGYCFVLAMHTYCCRPRGRLCCRCASMHTTGAVVRKSRDRCRRACTAVSLRGGSILEHIAPAMRAPHTNTRTSHRSIYT